MDPSGARPPRQRGRRSVGHFRRAADLHRHELSAGRKSDVLRAIDHVGDRRSAAASYTASAQRFVARIRLAGVQRIARGLEQEVAGVVSVPPVDPPPTCFTI